MTSLALLAGFVLLDLAIYLFLFKVRNKDPAALRTYLTFAVDVGTVKANGTPSPAGIGDIFEKLTGSLAAMGCGIRKDDLPLAFSVLVWVENARFRVSLGTVGGHELPLAVVETPRRHSPRDNATTRRVLAYVHRAITSTHGVVEVRWHKREEFAKGELSGEDLPYDGCPATE